MHRDPPRQNRYSRAPGLAILAALALGAYLSLFPGGAQSSSPAVTEPEELLVYAAASMTDVLEEIGRNYGRETGQPLKFSFAASATLARQIEAGARADVFVSADAEWMDYVESRALIDRATRFDVAGNRLVLVAPAESRLRLKIEPGFALATALGSGRLATGDPDFVPVGRYARAALMTLGAWEGVADRLVRAENVRAALVFVARGEVPLGIVYETDARVERRVRVVDVFPAASHPVIAYPVAVTARARGGAGEFVAYLRGPEAQEAFRRFGFQPPPAGSPRP